MNKEQKKIFEQLKKMGISENVGKTKFEKIELFEAFKKTLTNPNDIKEVDAEVAKLRASPEFKKNEIQKKIEDLNTDF
ncbi:hypothetical protein B7988_05320 [Fibrobacter sp. UWB1]|jgi:hypothetical protein|uniref:hypothetical protein n=1 Tax=Fibrobacter sp. UWB1 TaxID=1964355 RepID=UPI000B526C85|nr:hypothetical protein [Fibrobacter sp. UWB1]OWV26581.1 hypothetical protein B7988_05320 [Fibrobacter sp. UWB1]